MQERPPADEQPQKPLGAFAIVAAVVGGVLVLVADSTPVISAETPALLAVAAGLAAVVLGAVGWQQAQRRGTASSMAATGLVVGAIVSIIAWREYAAIEHQLDVARQCLADLIACGSRH